MMLACLVGRSQALKVNEYTVLDPAAVNEILEALAKEKKGGKKTAKARHVTPHHVHIAGV